MSQKHYKKQKNHYYHCYCRDFYTGDGINCDPVSYTNSYQNGYQAPDGYQQGYHGSNGHHHLTNGNHHGHGHHHGHQHGYHNGFHSHEIENINSENPCLNEKHECSDSAFCQYDGYYRSWAFEKLKAKTLTT